MSNNGVEFLLSSVDGTPWVPTQAWAVADEAHKDAIDKWHLVMDPPTPADSHALALHDLKRWLLFGSKGSRFLTIGVDKQGNANVRRIEREVAVEQHLRALKDQIPAHHQMSNISVLMPSIDDPSARRRYLDVVRRALPNARVLPEPEMIIEYFRLVKRTLSLDPDRNNVVLVVDIGASTSNLTMVLSNRRGEVTGAQTGMQRQSRLRAIQGTCGSSAGQWVDERIAELAGIELGAELTKSDRLAGLREIELTKIAVSREDRSSDIRGFTLTPAHLADIAIDVAGQLEPELKKMEARLWQQVTGTESARALTAPDRYQRGVQGPGDALKLVDVVLLAGGTCRLHGFRDALMMLLPTSPGPLILEVGDSFSIAAAMGALAHVLTDKYDPPRLRAAPGADDSSADPHVSLDGGLDVDIKLAWRPDKKGHNEQFETILERGDPIVYQAGVRDDVTEIDVRKNTHLVGRFIPDSLRKGDKQGLQPVELHALQDRPSIGFEVNSDRELRLRAPHLHGSASVWLDLRRFSTVFATPPARPVETVPPNAIIIDGAPEVVIDFGMSKTVMLAPTTGWFQLADLSEAKPQGQPDGLSESAEQATPQGQPSTQKDPSETDDLLTDVRPGPQEKPSKPTDGANTGQSDLPEMRRQSGGELDGNKARTPPTPKDQSPKKAHVTINYPAPPPQPEPLDLADFATRLKMALEHEVATELALPKAKITALLLALATRPNVLLAGPPGCGKSTLGRVAAQLLGLTAGETFHEVPVQAHWTSDKPLFHRRRGLLQCLLQHPAPRHLILLDEINLTCPEFFLARLFQAQESHQRRLSDFRAENWLTIGTLNIDDTSRPPSPKVVDRCFLLELDAEPEHRRGPRLRERLSQLPLIGGLPRVNLGANLPPELEERFERLVRTLKDAVTKHHLRQDVLPSRRSMDDVYGFVSLAAELHGLTPGLLAPIDALDWAIESRVLVRICGAVEQLKPLLDALTDAVVTLDLKRSHGRLQLFRAQAGMGFVSPWQ